jgi:ribose 5-phosphate isomerase A
MVEPGMRLGLGSGSTALLFVEAVGSRVAEGLSLQPAVATSTVTADRARDVGLPLADMGADEAPVSLDLAVDGADEIDPALRLVKGGGACLVREKIVAAMAARFVVIADGAKRVDRLGRFPLPVEVVPFGRAATAAAIAARLDVRPVLRRGDGGPVVTDNGNNVLDCPFGAIADPAAVAAVLSALPGVVDHGLFLGMADMALVGEADGRVMRLPAGA